MANLVSSAARAAAKSLADQGITVQHGHLLELVSALLGYGTYASLVAEEADTSLPLHLGDAQLYVVSIDRFFARFFELAPEPVRGHVRSVYKACLSGLEAAVAPRPVRSISGKITFAFMDEEAMGSIRCDPSVRKRIRESNACYDQLNRLESWRLNEEPWVATNTWAICAHAVFEGWYADNRRQDYGADGEWLQVIAELRFRKAGRGGLAGKVITVQIKDHGPIYELPTSSEEEDLDLSELEPV